VLASIGVGQVPLCCKGAFQVNPGLISGESRLAKEEWPAWY